jgi:20S proteasome, alpha and beta subunits
MTTIAFRDGVLATDTLIVDGRTICGHAVKISRSPRGDIGGLAGNLSDMTAFIAWLKSGADIRDLPCAKKSDGLLIRANGSMFWVNDGVESLFSAPFAAIGSGAPIAIGAMEHGATAIEAVKAAIKHDPDTGGRVRHLKLKHSRG